MLFVLVASGLALLALPGLTRRAGRRLHPAEWAGLCGMAVVGGALVVEAGALLYAAPMVARWSRAPGLADLCQRMLGPLAPGGWVAGSLAVGVALILPARGGVSRARAARVARLAHVERGLGTRRRVGDHEVVVLPTAQLVAVSVPPRPGRWPGQIVVSDGLVDALAPGELDAVVRHEAAHLRHGHHRHLLAAAAVDHAFAWFPAARWSTAALRVALERWADEDAAVAAGRAAVRDALVSVTRCLVAGPALAAFSAADSIGERLDALDHDPPRPGLVPHLLLYLPGTLLGATAMVALSAWACGAEAVMAMASRCLH